MSYPIGRAQSTFTTYYLAILEEEAPFKIGGEMIVRL